MEENENASSPFLAGITEAMESAMQLHGADDAVLMVATDGTTVSFLVGGDVDVIRAALLAYMKKNPKVAEIVCSAAFLWEAAHPLEKQRARQQEREEDGEEPSGSSGHGG